MENKFEKIIMGYNEFRNKYVLGDQDIMQHLSRHGQKPQIMVVACCDSRVDPALILQCDPGDLFVVRNVANIVPPYEKDISHHGTSSALEFGIRFLNIKHLILFGHSQCGGIQELLNNTAPPKNDFITSWVSLIKDPDQTHITNPDEYAKLALHISHKHCLTFPWIKEKVTQKDLFIHRWFFNVRIGEIMTYSEQKKMYQSLALVND